MIGVVCLVFKLWGGLIFDVYIISNCGLLEVLQLGDVVMVDKGFVYLKVDFERKCVKLYCFLFKIKSQFIKEEVEIIRCIVLVRIYVERKME